MSMKEQILSIAMQDPRFQETITVIEQQLSGTNMVAEDLTEAIQMLEYVLQNPEVYPEVRMAAIRDGLIDEGMFPPQFDEVLIISLLVVLYGMQDRLAQQGYSRGGLRVSGKQLAHRGQGGDRHLAHINDREAEVLRRMGGQGTVNPNTGLREYKGLKNVLKVALPIALSFVAPVLAPTIGAAVLGSGASALAQGVVGGAILGGGTSLLTGGDPLVGAVSGGLGGFAPVIGEGISAIAPGLDPSIVTGLTGGVTGALGQTLAGGDPLTGFATGAIGSFFAPTVAKGMENMTQRASTFVNNQMQANAAMSGMSGNMKPSLSQVASSDFSSAEAATPFVSASVEPVQEYIYPFDSRLYGADNLMSAEAAAPTGTSTLDESLNNLYEKRLTAKGPGTIADEYTNIPGLNKFPVRGGGRDLTVDMPSIGQVSVSKAPQGEGIFAGIRNLIPESIAELLPESTAGQLLLGGALASTLLGGLGEGDQLAIQQAESSGLFDRPINNFDFVKIRSEANERGMGMADFLNSSFFLSDQSKFYTPTNAARGGIMDAPGYVNGPGDGRDDVINARLSDGEYVIDAEVVSLLGNGSNEAGAKLLDDMRKKIRTHKGKVLAKGRFSPDAKSPLEYMRRSA